MEEEKLIECVRAHEILYNKSVIGYRISGKKEEAWAEVACQLGTTENDCVKRWQSLRERYSRELRKQDSPSGSAAGVNGSWPLFDNMGFLKEYVKPRPVRSTINILGTKQSSPSTSPFLASPNFIDSFDLSQEMSCSQPTPLSRLSPTQTPAPVATPSPTSKRSRKRPLGDNDGDVEFREVLKMYKDMHKERMGQTGNDTVRGFGQMITSIIAEVSEKKQMKAIQSVTNIVMTIKYEPEE